MNAYDGSRRGFLARLSALALSALVAGPAAAQGAKPAATPAAKPAALPKLPLTNPQAQALAYSENAASVKHALFKPGSDCANCNFYKGVAGQAYGPCLMFPQNTVSAKGWCSAWAKKAG